MVEQLTNSDVHDIRPAQNPMMLITPGRIYYRGTFGAHKLHEFAAPTIYASPIDSILIDYGDRKVESQFALVPAHTPHKVESCGLLGAQIILEPETIGEASPCIDAVPEQQELAKRIVTAFEEVTQGIADCSYLDELLVGELVMPRQIDPRIRAVVDRVQAYPADKHSVEYYADSIDLSSSRFSHLFRDEIGVTFRRFCAWKRVRGVLSIMNQNEKLVETALNVGYADSTHFCHAVRQFFGLRPRDLSNIVFDRNFRRVVNSDIVVTTH